MRLLISLLCLSGVLQAQHIGYAVLNREAGPWDEMLQSIGLPASAPADASVLVMREGAAADAGIAQRVLEGDFLILEGHSALARSFGFKPLARSSRLVSLIDSHRADLPLILEKPLEIAETELPAGATVYTRERWTHVPVSAGIRSGKGGVLWVAANPGKHGFEHFPFLLNALCDLGFQPPFAGTGLWAFFDYAYRARVDVNWFAKRWHAAGISALHVAAWHFYEAESGRDRYLETLIEACHREGILVYAWLELPHVSEKFWADHPAWREQTALLQDAQLDWRKLMNLADPACNRAVHEGVESLVRRFAWDGLNFAELYYESLEGAKNPARFTPVNGNIRQLFEGSPGGFDPVELWGARKDPESLRRFLDFRAALAQSLQQEWLTAAESYRTFKPDLEVILTHVDDRLDTGMRDAIGADTSQLLPLMAKHDFTFLIEDPATVWNLGPQRYPLIAKKYPNASRLAVDINIVDRYQDVYPTKQQTGIELSQLVHVAGLAFPRVALYFENSLSAADYQLLSYADSAVSDARWEKGSLRLNANQATKVRWDGAAEVDGAAWPVKEDGFLVIPAGKHQIRQSESAEPFLMKSTSGALKMAARQQGGITFEYDSAGVEIARFSAAVDRLQVDNASTVSIPATTVLRLPRGNHSVIAWPQAVIAGRDSRSDSR